MGFGTQAKVGLALLTASVVLAGAIAAITFGAPRAQAVPNYGDYKRQIATSNELKRQLAGTNGELSRQIEQLSDLTERQIPAAEDAADKAEDAAATAKSQADAAAERLKAAQKDKRTLEEQIARTGKDYDDAKAAVAQLARNSFHGSDASDTMELMTKSKTTSDFIDSMQSDAAVTRSESSAADAAATTLNTSRNRKQRLDAIEREIAELKSQADSRSASAQRAVQAAHAQQRKLTALRNDSSKRRKALERKQSGLKTAAAREAAQVVLIKSQIDAYNQKIERERQRQAATAAASNTQGQYSGPSSTSASSGGSSVGTSSRPSTRPSTGGSSARPSGMSYSVPGNCPPHSTYCYGHATGNVPGVWGSSYPWDQCTRYAYNRRQDLGLPVGSYLGNGQDWGWKARALGYVVNNTPHVGAAISFRAGQLGHSPLYGHVGVVEHINSDGSILISESGSIWGGRAHWDTIYNPGLYTYVHY